LSKIASKLGPGIGSPLLVLNLRLYIVNSVGRLDFEGDSLSREGFDEYLHFELLYCVDDKSIGIGGHSRPVGVLALNFIFRLYSSKHVFAFLPFFFPLSSCTSSLSVLVSISLGSQALYSFPNPHS
jgi:hypothetical protein